MTPQNKLKRFLRFLSGKPHTSGKSSSVATDEIRVEYPLHPDLQRSKTDNMIIRKARNEINGERDSLSQSYDDGYVSRTSTDRSLRAARSLSLQPNRLSPLMSYREAVTVECEPDCPCECHKSDRDQAYLTLCKCHMSGYESYRKAVYGGPRRLKKKPSMKLLDQEKRKSLPPNPKKLYGSADTLGSEHSCDTIKATSEYTNSSSGKSTGSSGAKSHNSPSPLSVQDNQYRSRELTLTQDHLSPSLSPKLPDPSLTIGLHELSLKGIPTSPITEHQVGVIPDMRVVNA